MTEYSNNNVDATIRSTSIHNLERIYKDKLNFYETLKELGITAWRDYDEWVDTENKKITFFNTDEFLENKKYANPQYELDQSEINLIYIGDYDSKNGTFAFLREKCKEQLTSGTTYYYSLIDYSCYIKDNKYMNSLYHKLRCCWKLLFSEKQSWFLYIGDSDTNTSIEFVGDIKSKFPWEQMYSYTKIKKKISQIAEYMN